MFDGTHRADMPIGSFVKPERWRGCLV